MNNKEAGIKLVESAPSQPYAGVYGDPSFYDAYIDLIKSIGELIPVEMSSGSLQNNGVGATARARCKAITAKAKIMEEIMSAITKGRI